METPSKPSTKEQLFEGNWNFKGYWPKDCKETPSCFVENMKFTRLHPKKTTRGFTGFDTEISKTGETCNVDDSTLKHYGYTWITKNLINFGGG